MRKLTVGIAGGLLLAVVACNLHLDQSLLDADQATEGNLTEDSGVAAPEGDAGTKPTTHDPTVKDAGADARVTTDAGDAGPIIGDNKLCPAGSVVEHEPNDAVLSANTLPIGAMCGHIDVANDADWYTWEIGADGMIKLFFDAESDGYVTLVNADQTVSFSGGTGTRYQFQTKPNTRLTAKVFSLGGQKTQSYVITR